MLALAMLMHNNTKNMMIGYSPNHLIIGLEPAGISDYGEGSDNPLAKIQVNQLRQQRILAQEALNRVANHHFPSQNMFEKGQRV